MKHLEQVKELIQSGIGTLFNAISYIMIKETATYEEYNISFPYPLSPITVRSFSNGTIHIKIENAYFPITTLDASYKYLYIAAFKYATH